MAALGLLLVADEGRAQQFVTAQLVAQGLRTPTVVCSPPGDTARVFIADLPGTIHVVRDGVLLPTPFLDLTAVIDAGPDDDDRGILGLAFAPDYDTSGCFYVYYGTAGTRTLVERFQVSPADPDVADPDSGSLVFGPLLSALGFHHGGGLAFGPDGMLYLAIGDERDNNQGCGAQLGDRYFGKLLRLLPGGGAPADNPFVGDPTVLDEIWALGLRQPYRMAFDDATGDLWIGDVGEGTREEINVVPAGLGGFNFGWAITEGAGCASVPKCDEFACPGTPFVAPRYDYGHDQGRCCVIGGGVYRGTEIPALAGRYLFADWCTGRFWSLPADRGGAPTEFTAFLADAQIAHPIGFGTDAQGAMYVLESQLGATDQGRVWKLVGVPTAFADLGHGLAGGGGQAPSLSAEGSMGPDTPIAFQLSGALPASSAYMLFGIAELSAPFKGGVLVPDPTPPGFAVALPIGPSGAIELAGTWPAGAPSGFSTYYQFWVLDPGGPAGFAASNALVGVTP